MPEDADFKGDVDTYDVEKEETAQEHFAVDLPIDDVPYPAARSAPQLHSQGWHSLLHRGEQASADEDAVAVVTNASGQEFGQVFWFVNEGSLNARVAGFKTFPNEPQMSCVEWLCTVEEFGAEVVASLGWQPLGTPTLYMHHDGMPSLVWRNMERPRGGVVLELLSMGPACGRCIGCLSAKPNREQAAHTWVYFIQASADGPIKIGYSASPRDRLAGLQTAHPHNLYLRAKIPGGLEVERAMHRLFAKDRIHTAREWFHPSAELTAFIAEISLGFRGE